MFGLGTQKDPYLCERRGPATMSFYCKCGVYHTHGVAETPSHRAPHCVNGNHPEGYWVVLEPRR